jgi:hypothetical protein
VAASGDEAREPACERLLETVEAGRDKACTEEPARRSLGRRLEIMLV